MRALVVVGFLMSLGCGSATPPPASAPQKLPPEVEFDPATAAAKYQAAKKSSRP